MQTISDNRLTVNLSDSDNEKRQKIEIDQKGYVRLNNNGPALADVDDGYDDDDVSSIDLNQVKLLPKPRQQIKDEDSDADDVFSQKNKESTHFMNNHNLDTTNSFMFDKHNDGQEVQRLLQKD